MFQFLPLKSLRIFLTFF